MSAFSAVASYRSEDLTRRTYQGPASARQLTGLSARLFGTWTLLSTVARAYAAYHISSKELYAIAFSTYAIAVVHFGSEWLVFKTMTMRSGLLPPFTVASVTTIWMAVQRGHYTAI
jgi:hypothetical protein